VKLWSVDIPRGFALELAVYICTVVARMEIIMTIKERDAVKQLMTQALFFQDAAKVSQIKKDFIRDFPVDVRKKPQYIIQLLEIAYCEKNADDVEYALIIAGSFDLITTEYQYILLKLLEADWHFKHENIAEIFQKLKIPDTVEYLYKTALTQFEYLEFDEFFALAVKCIWALGDIRTDEAIKKLKLLAQSDNEIIKENALNQLQRIQ